MIARVTGRRPASAGGAVATGTQVVYPRPERAWPVPAQTASAQTLPAQTVPAQTVPAQTGTVQTGTVQTDYAGVAAIAPASPPIAVPESCAPVPATIPLLPGERTPARMAKFTVVNACTVASLLMGLLAVFFALDGELRLAALALLGCVAFDGIDGGLARRLGVASPFGAQMDSLADLSSFGVATGIVVHHWLVAEGASPIIAGPACALVAVCAAIRLARFNVSPKNGRFFSGVPTTMAAAVLALGILIGPELPAAVLVAAVAVYALAMVTSFPYAKLASVIRLPLWLAVVPAITAMISISAAFVLVVGAYLVSGPLLWLYLRRRPAFA